MRLLSLIVHTRILEKAKSIRIHIFLRPMHLLHWKEQRKCHAIFPVITIDLQGRHSRFLAGMDATVTATSPARHHCFHRFLFLKIQPWTKLWLPCLPWWLWSKEWCSAPKWSGMFVKAKLSLLSVICICATSLAKRHNLEWNDDVNNHKYQTNNV